MLLDKVYYELPSKVESAFTGEGNAHGGQETIILTIYNVVYHWGAIVVSPGYTDPILYAAGSNPYGTSYSTPQGDQGIPREILQAARYQGGRVARFDDVIAAHRDQLVPTPQEAAQGAEAAGASNS